ncbi:MAG TPA: RcnB family protein [Luteimonas sp.]|nr:RcnB family protein [Luteimonas sp.]
MKRLLLATSIALISLSSTAVLASPGGGHHKHGHHRLAQGHATHHDNGLHLGQQKQAFRRGERIPQVYLQQRYYVQDYRVYNLAPPQPGYRWVRPDDGRYLLIATATGLISQILGN